MIFVRHGESEFNVHYSKSRIDPGIEDPAITASGREQARVAAKSIASLGRVERLIASPYRRTLETAEIIADELGLPVSIEPVIRERAFFTCDIGSPRSTMAARFPTFDFGDLPEVWWPPLDETEDQLAERCARFRTGVAQWTDWSSVVAISHWGFIRGLTGEAVPNGTVLRFDPNPDCPNPDCPNPDCPG